MSESMEAESAGESASEDDDAEGEESEPILIESEESEVEPQSEDANLEEESESEETDLASVENPSGGFPASADGLPRGLRRIAVDSLEELQNTRTQSRLLDFEVGAGAAVDAFLGKLNAFADDISLDRLPSPFLRRGNCGLAAVARLRPDRVEQMVMAMSSSLWQECNDAARSRELRSYAEVGAMANVRLVGFFNVDDGLIGRYIVHLAERLWVGEGRGSTHCVAISIAPPEAVVWDGCRRYDISTGRRVLVSSAS